MSEVIHIENFEIIDRLGQGGMATVWKARQSSLDRLVAIKILAPSFATDPADIARFRDEARAAGRLKHPGSVQVYDANVTAGSYYFVMEMVDGYTIGEWIRRKGRLGETDALAVAESAIAALNYAWTNFGIIHCDIKPENVMIDADGTVKIADLGLARAIGAMHIRESEQEVLGTPAYMSPEQVMGRTDLDCRADIYAMGSMLYHMVTGHPLFAGEGDEDEIMRRQLAATVPSPCQEAPELSRRFTHLLTRMLAKEPKDRPRDWKAVLECIRCVRTNRPLPGEAPHPGASTIFLVATESESAADLIVPDRGWYGTRLVFVILLLLTGGLAAWWFTQGKPADRKAPRPLLRKLPVSVALPAKPTPPQPAPVARHQVTPAEQEAMAQVARVLLRDGVETASRQAAEIAAQHAAWGADSDFAALQKLLVQARAAEQAALDTFTADKGKPFALSLRKQSVSGTIGDMAEGRVHLVVPGNDEQTFTLDDLGVGERLRRLSCAGDGSAGAAILEAVWACRAHDSASARATLSSIPPPSGPIFLRVIDEPQP